MDKRLKKQIIGCAIFYFAVFFILMIIGTFYDLEINKALFNYENKFGVIFEDWGMYAMFVVPVFAWSTLLGAYHPIEEAFDIAESIFPFFKYLRKNKITYYICFILLHALYAYFAYKAFNESNDLFNRIMYDAVGNNLQDLLVNAGVSKTIAVLCWTLLRIAPILLIGFLIRKIDKMHRKAFEFMAIAGLALFYGSEIINDIKDHFHRIRFREMIAYSHGLINEDGWSSRGSANLPKEWVATTDFSAFDRWYRIGNDMGVYSEAHSFPSGHTSAAAFSMLLAPLFSKCKALNKYFIPAFSVGFLYTFAMGISRLVRGAHYLTDISTAAIIIFAMLLLIVFIMNIFEKISQKNSGSK